VGIVALGITAALHAGFALLNADPIGHDSSFHPMWLEMFSASFAQGELYPRWLTGTYAGFGSPTFYFYPPLTYGLGSLLSLIGFGNDGNTLFNVIHLIASLLSFATAWMMLKAFGRSRIETFAGSLLYAFSPYVFIDVFARSALSEHLALAWLPLLFLGAHSLLSCKYFQGWTITSVAIALLVLTSIPATCCAIIGVMAYAISSGRISLSCVGFGSLSAITAAAISAIYLMPAIGMSWLIQADRYKSTSEFNALSALFIDSPLAITVSIGVAAVLLIACLLMLRERHDMNSTSKPWIILLALVVFLHLPIITDWLYEYVQPFKLIRYSWRFTMIAMLGITILITRDLKKHRIAFAGLAILSCFFYASYGYNHVLPGERTPARILDRDAPEYITRFVQRDDSSLIEYLRQEQNSAVITGVDLNANARVTPKGISADVTSDGGWARLHQFYWPLWNVQFNAKAVQTRSDSNGMLEVLLPAGEASLEATMGTSAIERTSAIISIVAILGFALVQSVRRVRRRKKVGLPI
jgi:uncharacterized membrane protein